MNKLFTKIASLSIGLALAIGVGVAVGGNEAKVVKAADTITTYTFTTKSWAATSGGSAANWTSGKDGGGFSNNGIQVTTNSSGANGTSPKSFTKVTKVIATYNTNKSAGAGSIVVKIGDNEAKTNSVGYSGSSDGRSANFTSQFDYSTSQTGSIKITVNTTTNSIYLVSVAITESSGPQKLATPSPTYDDNTKKVSWTVSGASSYQVSVDGGDYETDTSPYDVSGLSTGVEHTISVIAKGDGTNYTDSDAGSVQFTPTEPAIYTSVTVTGGSVQGNEKGSAYIQCSATAQGTNIPASPAFTWYVTETDTYGTTTSVANKASINDTGKVTFNDNCTVYVWALAPDGTTHNATGYAVTASNLIDPKGSESNPYTCAEAREIATTTSNNTHVRGIIYEVSSYNSTYKSITYWISDDGTGSSSNKDGLQIYSGKGLNGADFNAKEDLTVGSVIVVQGDLKVYQTTTYELDKNSVIKSIVLPKTVSSISVKTAPSKTGYDAGEFFVPAGLVINVNYDDSTSEEITYSGNESKFTFTPSITTALTTSNTTVTITYGGKSTTQAITVNAVPAVISVTVTPSSGSINIGSTITLAANVVVEGGAAQTVNWSSSSDSIATVSNGVVTGVAAGTATITATSTVNNQKSGSATITVVDPSDTKIGTYTLVKDANLLSDGDWIVITNIGATYGMGEQGSNNYRSQVAVTKSNSDIVISDTLNTTLKAAKLSVKNSHFEILTDEGYLYASSTSSNNIGSRATNSDANGEWIFTINSSTGNSTVTAQGTNTKNILRYNSANTRFSCYGSSTTTMAEVHIYKKLPSTVAVSLSTNKDVITTVGGTATLTAKAYSDSGKTKEISGLTNADFTFTSSDTSVLTVDENGVVTAAAGGSATITASRNECDATVTIKVVYVTIDLINSGTSIEAGSVGTFTFTWSSDSLKPTNYDVEWSSSNENAFAVDNDGSYLAGDSGLSSTITVNILDEDLNEYVATRVFSTVSTFVPATHISVTESSGVTAYIGNNVSLNISVLGDGDVPASNQNVVCTSSNTDILTVSNEGIITPVSRGVATVTVVDPDNLCTPVVINVRVRNAVLGNASIIGTFDFTDYTTTDKTMEDWYTAGTSDYKSAEFTGTYQAADSGYIRFGSGSGNGAITVSYSSSIVKQVVVSAKLYGSDEQDCGIEGATSSGSFNYDDFADVVYTFNSPVSEFEFATNGSKRRLYVKSITIYTDREDISLEADPQALYQFEETNMHLDDYNSNEGYCKDSEHHYYLTAKNAFNSLTKEQRDMYITNEAFAEGWARLNAWAAANGESLNSSSLLATARVNLVANIAGNSSTIIIIALISAISAASIGGYFLFRKKKED